MCHLQLSDEHVGLCNVSPASVLFSSSLWALIDFESHVDIQTSMDSHKLTKDYRFSCLQEKQHLPHQRG
jgi:hypothetical protein